MKRFKVHRIYMIKGNVMRIWNTRQFIVANDPLIWSTDMNQDETTSRRAACDIFFLNRLQGYSSFLKILYLRSFISEDLTCGSDIKHC